MSFWGLTETPLRGWVDILADASVASAVADDFAGWLAHPGQRWDVFHYLHLAPGRPTLAAMAAQKRPWRMVALTSLLHSLEYVLRLHPDTSHRHVPLGPKARHEARREIRLYQRRMGDESSGGSRRRRGGRSRAEIASYRAVGRSRGAPHRGAAGLKPPFLWRGRCA